MDKCEADIVEVGRSILLECRDPSCECGCADFYLDLETMPRQQLADRYKATIAGVRQGDHE